MHCRILTWQVFEEAAMKLSRRPGVFAWGILAVVALGDCVLVYGLSTEAPDADAMAAEARRST